MEKVHPDGQFRSFGWKRKVGLFHGGIHKMESKMGSEVGGRVRRNKQSNQSSQSWKGSCEEVEELNALEKMEDFFAAISWCGVLTRKALRIAGGWCFPECQLSGSYPVIFLVCLNMAGVPGKHFRPRYLAICTVSPKYIFIHNSSILYLQSKDESPNQRMCVARGVIMNALFSQLWELWSPALCPSILLLCHPL